MIKDSAPSTCWGITYNMIFCLYNTLANHVQHDIARSTCWGIMHNMIRGRFNASRKRTCNMMFPPFNLLGNRTCNITLRVHIRWENHVRHDTSKYIAFRSISRKSACTCSMIVLVKRCWGTNRTCNKHYYDIATSIHGDHAGYYYLLIIYNFIFLYKRCIVLFCFGFSTSFLCGKELPVFISYHPNIIILRRTRYCQ